MNPTASLIERSWLSLLLLIAGCALFTSTLNASYADLGGAFSPVFFPRIILVGWIILALLSLLADVLSSNRQETAQWMTVGTIAISLFAYIELMPVVGFFLSSVVFAIIVLLSTGQRKVLDIALFAILVPGALLLLFNHLLTMPLPVSPFVWWL